MAGAAGDPFVGRTLGEFVLRERIGEGGFGAVYRAVQPALEREAVIKVLHARLSASKSAKERFLREAKLASKLDHPYAAHVYAFGAEADGALWIAMELVRGTPLDQVLKHQGPLTLERFVALLDRVCEVVHTAHEAGIVHRDLKPANVMVLSRAGRLLPKLLDFGIAKGLVGGGSVDETLEKAEEDPDPFGETLNTPTSSLTVQGTVMGSPPYMAPEQWMDAAAADARTDLYALGIVAFECIAGRPPFTGANLTQIAKAHASGVVPPLNQGAALDKVLQKALAKAPSDRFQSALEFAAAFRKASGVVEEKATLPALDPAQRDLAINGAPQPIAEAIAAFEASRNAFQARDALALVGRTIARYLGLLALACRSRVAGEDSAAELIRTLHRRALTDREWIELARTLTAAWVKRRDAYPIPELITALHDDGVGDSLEALAALRDAEAPTDDTMVALLEAALAHVAIALEGLAFLRDYPLVVPSGNHGEKWMGVRRAQRLTIAVRGKGLTGGAPALLDRDGVPVLTLAPLFQIAAPTPGAPLELFLFEGRDRRGAKLVALPGGFEQHDDALWAWFREQLGGLDEERTKAVDETPPYRGLAAFGADDAALFVGREKQVDAFVNRLRVQPLLAVVGPSGAGKSSFVHAGAAPALGWRTVTMRPGPSPLASLVARLEHAGIAPAPEWTTGERMSGRIPIPTSLRDAIAADREALGHLLRVDANARGPILVVVDQLEEMFTLCTDAEERRLFAEALAFAARAPDDGVRVVFTLRDDFLVRTEQVGALRNRIGQGLQLLTVPAPDDLLRIVVEPARRYGYEYEGDLAKDMVKEVADQPGSLALISFAASVLWELRDRHFKQLTRSAYKTLGGVGGALAKHAETTLESMPPEERALTREAFRHLVTSQNTRAVLGRRELRQLLGNDAHADNVIEKLIAARLLVASESEVAGETIEIIHEALLSTWPRLAEWRREDSEGLVFREQLRSAAKQWNERGRAKGLLWRGDALADFVRWRARASGALTDVETAFADASLNDAARGRRNVRVYLAAVFAALGVVVVVLAILNANISAKSSELHDRLQRRYEDQGRTLVLANEPEKALASLEKAHELGAGGRAHDLLVAQALQATDGEVLETRTSGPLVLAMFTHDGRQIITAGNMLRGATVWDAETGAKVRALAGAIDAYGLAPDDSFVVSSRDNTVQLIEVATGKTLATLAHTSRVTCATLSPDGSIVGTATVDGIATIWSRDGVRRGSTPSSGSKIDTCRFSPTGTLFATGDGAGAIQLVDPANGALIRTLEAGSWLRDLAFAPDGATILAGGQDGIASAWDTATGARRFSVSHRDAVRSVAFSPDGTQIATGSDDHTAALWNAHTGAQEQYLEGHTANVLRVRFSPDGAHVATASEDASSWLWDAHTGAVEARWHAGEDRIQDVAFDRDGKRLVTAGEDGRATVLLSTPQRHVIWLRGHEDTVLDARFSPDATRIATAGADRTLRFWDANTGAQLSIIRAPSSLQNAAWSPDGTRVATFGLDGKVRIWDVATSHELQTMTGADTEFDGVLEWSAAGIATATNDGWLRLWNPATGALVFERKAHDGLAVYSVAFSPDGIVTTGGDGKTAVWDLTGRPTAAFDRGDGPVSARFDRKGTRLISAIQRERAKILNAKTGVTELELIGHLGRVADAGWSPDGALAITASADATARIWNTSNGETLAILPQAKFVVAAGFSPDGTRVITAGGKLAAVERLPSAPPSGAALEELLACRVPWTVEDDRLVGREKADCLRDHRR